MNSWLAEHAGGLTWRVGHCSIVGRRYRESLCVICWCRFRMPQQATGCLSQASAFPRPANHFSETSLLRLRSCSARVSQPSSSRNYSNAHLPFRPGIVKLLAGAFTGYARLRQHQRGCDSTGKLSTLFCCAGSPSHGGHSDLTRVTLTRADNRVVKRSRLLEMVESGAFE